MKKHFIFSVMLLFSLMIFFGCEENATETDPAGDPLLLLDTPYLAWPEGDCYFLINILNESEYEANDVSFSVDVDWDNGAVHADTSKLKIRKWNRETLEWRWRLNEAAQGDSCQMRLELRHQNRLIKQFQRKYALTH